MSIGRAAAALGLIAGLAGCLYAAAVIAANVGVSIGLPSWATRLIAG